MTVASPHTLETKVAPVRERGLKSKFCNMYLEIRGRSREGAWIEMYLSALQNMLVAVAPVRERGLKLRLAQ